MPNFWKNRGLTKYEILILIVFIGIVAKLAMVYMEPESELIRKPYTLKLDTGGHQQYINALLINKDATEIISASSDKTIRVWNAETGQEKRKILGDIGEGSIGKIYSMALSHNNEYLAVTGYLQADLRARAKKLNKKIIDQKPIIRIYHYPTGKLIKILKTHLVRANVLAFSHDDAYLVSGSSKERIRVWNTSDWKKTQSIEYFYKDIYGLVVTKRGKAYSIYTIGDENKIQHYHLSNNKMTMMKEYQAKFKLDYIAVNNSEVVVSGRAKGFLVLDKKLKLKRTVRSKGMPYGLTYSPNGKYLATGADGDHKQVNIYRTSDYKLVRSYKGKSEKTSVIKFLNNNKLITTSSANTEILVWNRKTGKNISHAKSRGAKILSVGINGNTIGFGIRRQYVDRNNRGPLEKKFNLNDFKIKDISADEHRNFKRAAIVNDDYVLKVGAPFKMGGYSKNYLDIIENGEVVSSLERTPSLGHDHYSYGWYKDYVITGGSNGHLSVYTEKKEVALLIGHTGTINAIAVDGDRLITGSSDQTIRIWDLTQVGDDIKIYPMLNVFVTKDDEWVAWTKDGFFNASKNGTKFIGYHVNQGMNKEAEYITVDALYNTFYRPDLIQKALFGEDLGEYSASINIEEILKDGLAPEVRILTQQHTTSKRDLDLKMQVCEKTGGFDNLSLLINGMPVAVVDTSRALKLKRKSKRRKDCFEYNQSISLARGVNDIGFKATNKSGNMESKTDVVRVVYKDSGLKKVLKNKLSRIDSKQNINDLHVLAIAVNEYKDKELQLKYSINDATNMLDSIVDIATPIFNQVHTHKLFDEQVTRENIKNIFEKIPSTRDDVFLLYIAGHGVTDEFNGNYYFIPYDFVNADNKQSIKAQGVGQKDLMLGLSKIQALKSLVLLDTCNSGSFVEANVQKTTTNRLAKATGRATISASSKSQVALEGFNNHGVFTYTLLEAMRGKGYQGDNQITTNELSSYVEAVLPDRTFKKWGYKQMPQSSMYGTDFNLGVKAQ